MNLFNDVKRELIDPSRPTEVAGCPLRARRALSLFEDVPLRTRRVLSLIKDVPLRTTRALSPYRLCVAI